MSKFVTLMMIVGERTDYASGEDDHEGMVRTEVLTPVVIDMEEVRAFYPRKYGKIGTRLTFKNSAGMAVCDLFEEVCKAVKVPVAPDVQRHLDEARAAAQVASDRVTNLVDNLN